MKTLSLASLYAANMKAGTIRLGLIGCGMAVRRVHWPVLRRLRREIEVVALTRRNYHQARAFADQMQIGRVYKDYRDLLNDSGVDAVLTAVPIDLNGPVLLDALRAGKHVLAEKPIAASLEQAQSILEEVSRRTQTVLIGENFRYRPEVATAKRLIDSAEIGRVFAFQLKVNFDITAKPRKPWISRGWRHDAKHRGGFTLDGGVHPVAALRCVLGEVHEVYAEMLRTSSATRGPDTLLMQVRMTDGVVGHCFFCYTAKESRENPFDFKVFGTKGVLTVGRTVMTITRELGNSGQRWKHVRNTEYLLQWKNFCAAIRGKECVRSTAADAYGDLAVIDAAFRSSAEGKPCVVPKVGKSA